MHFEIVGEIDNVETIAVGAHIRDISSLALADGGSSKVLRQSGFRREERAALSYEAHGIGKKKMKIKRFLD